MTSYISKVGEWGIQFSLVTQSCLNFCEPVDCSMPGLPVHHQLLESAQFLSIELMMSSNHLILCHPPLHLPSIVPSIRGLSNESVLYIRWPKYWSLIFSISPSNEYSGLISLDWLLWSPWCPKGSQESSPTPQFRKHQFFHSLWSNSYFHIWLLEKP